MSATPKICFIVGSAIVVNNDYPIDIWNENPRRSDFSSDERYRQTIYTLVNLRNISNKAKTFIVDTTLNYHDFYLFESEFENVTYWPVARYNKEIADFVNKNSSKSLCEAMIIREFVKQNKEELAQYDFIVKVSGRYVFEFDLTKLVKNKFMFNSKIEFNPGRFMCPSTIYAFDTSLIWKYEIMLDNIISLFSQNEQQQLYHSMETCLYTETLDMQDQIEYIPMTTFGFAGISKKYVRTF
jgi:hypothetical protein